MLGMETPFGILSVGRRMLKYVAVVAECRLPRFGMMIERELLRQTCSVSRVEEKEKARVRAGQVGSRFAKTWTRILTGAARRR